MTGWLEDLRHALRPWRSAPWTTLLIVLTLALTIGATSGMFSVVHGVLLRPLPFHEPERLVSIHERRLADAGPARKGVPAGLLPLAPPNFADLRRQVEAEGGPLAGVAGWIPWEVTLAGDPAPIRLDGRAVTASLFEVLGVEPAIGRTFLAEEDAPGRGDVVILGHALWRDRFGGDPGIVGRTVSLEGSPFTVVGVMPPGFDFPERTPIWKPIGWDLYVFYRNFFLMQSVGRMAPGTDLDTVRAGLATTGARLAAEFPASNGGRTMWAGSLTEMRVGEVRRALWLLFGAVACVLLMSCATVSNVLLARLAARRSEFGLRIALGAGRARLARQLVAEGLLLALAAGALGLVIAPLALRVLLPLVADELPRVDEVGVDGTVLAFTVAVSVLSALLASVVPTLQALRTEVADALKMGGGGRGGFGRRSQAVTVVAQVAVAVPLLIGAGLMLRSFDRVLAVDPGFEPEGVLTAQFALVPQTDYYEQPKTVRFFRELIARIEALPGVEAAGATWFLPLSGRTGTVAFEIEGRPDPPPDRPNQAAVQAVTPGYFETLRIPVLSGRGIDRRDGPESPPVALINETAARRYWPAGDPVGERIAFSVHFGPAGSIGEGGRMVREIVGVVGDVRHSGLTSDTPPEIYFPNHQSTWRWASLVVRGGTSEPLALAGPIREILDDLDPNLALDEVYTFDRLLARSVAHRNLNRWLSVVFAALAAALAAVGVYSVTSLGVSLRSRDLALRMTVGARPAEVLTLVLGRALRLALAGSVAGLAAAVLAARWLGGLVFETDPLDPLIYAGVTILVIAVAVAGAFLPARRAARLDPLAVLRER